MYAVFAGLPYAADDFSPRRKVRPGRVILATGLGLVVLGVVMVYSASVPFSLRVYGDGLFCFRQELRNLAVGFLALGLGWALDYRMWRKVAPGLWFLGLLLLGLVLFSSWGQVAHGARRWLGLPGGMRFQPVELVKFALVVFAARLFSGRVDSRLQAGDGGLWFGILLLGLGALGVALQPDIGSTVILVALLLLMLFVCGMRWRYLLALGGCALPALAWFSWRAAHGRRRWFGFFNPFADVRDIGYQLHQAFIALGRGGLWGVGLGAGQQKLGYLPEAHTDFILAVIGEELGFVGVAAVLAAFGVLVVCGFAVARMAPDAFGGCLAAGLTLLVALPAVVNVGVVAGLLPTKGLPLPLVSYGGSALVVNLLALGVLLNIDSAGREDV